jgi:hypothetical protein
MPGCEGDQSCPAVYLTIILVGIVLILRSLDGIAADFELKVEDQSRKPGFIRGRHSGLSDPLKTRPNLSDFAA